MPLIAKPTGIKECTITTIEKIVAKIDPTLS